MKYLDYPLLAQLSDTLSSHPSPEQRLNVRFEAYSVKPIGRERKMFKEMEEAYMSGQEEMDEMSFSPEMKEAGLSSCFGRLDEKESRKVHFLLVSTLNAAFPDHDFSALRPDHFTRELSSAQVLGHLTGSLLGPSAAGPAAIILGPPPSTSLHPGSSPHHLSPSHFSSSPSSLYSAALPNSDLYMALNEVVPLDECEVYSFFPGPESDPHLDPEEGEGAEDGYEEEEGIEMDTAVEDVEMDMDMDEASWGQAGMELDDVPQPAPGRMRTRSDDAAVRKGKGPKKDEPNAKAIKEGVDDDVVFVGMKEPRAMGRTGSGAAKEEEVHKRIGKLLWSANYFFYSKRQKRILFLTCWCRKRPLSPLASLQDTSDELGSFPLPISSSFNAPSPLNPASSPLATLKSRHRMSHNRSNARPGHKRSRPELRAPIPGGVGRDVTSSTIPIRGMETPRRLATSAPSAITPIHGRIGVDREVTPGMRAEALARMSAGGFKPKQTPARMAMNAARAKQGASAMSAEDTPTKGAGGAAEDEQGKRRDRSESTTPQPQPQQSSGGGSFVGSLREVMQEGAGGAKAPDGVKGKRVRV